MSHYKTKVVVEFQGKEFYQGDITEQKCEFGYVRSAIEIAQTVIKAHGKKKAEYRALLVDIFSVDDGMGCVDFETEEKLLVV